MFYSGNFCPFWGSMGPFKFRGSKSNFIVVEFFVLGILPNSNFTPVLWNILRITAAFWGSEVQN
jgi:hypothetical protein